MIQCCVSGCKSRSERKIENTTFHIWINEPMKWWREDEALIVITDLNTDFWQGTYYNFYHNNGHFFGLEIEDDFTIQMCIEANFTTLYDQAGVMIYADEKHWLKAGIEYNDDQPMIGSVLTNEISDWATGVYTGNPKKFWIKMTKVGGVVCIKYSTDKIKWNLLRLAPFVKDKILSIGPMCCSPKRDALQVKFSELSISKPAEDSDILHSDQDIQVS